MSGQTVVAVTLGLHCGPKCVKHNSICLKKKSFDKAQLPQDSNVKKNTLKKAKWVFCIYTEIVFF